MFISVEGYFDQYLFGLIYHHLVLMFVLCCIRAFANVLILKIIQKKILLNRFNLFSEPWNCWHNWLLFSPFSVLPRFVLFFWFYLFFFLFVSIAYFMNATLWIQKIPLDLPNTMEWTGMTTPHGIYIFLSERSQAWTDLWKQNFPF